MAADASSSGGGAASAESYVGSLISLTSKSEIRYEGILHNINTVESSIGLRNVRSFGTEGRKKDGSQVSESEKVYEYILFRGSDIKDLQVKSSPPAVPPQASSLHNDPAIIQSHYSPLPSTSSNLTSDGTGAVAQLNPQPAQYGFQSGFQRTSFPTGLPLYQPGVGYPSTQPAGVSSSTFAVPPAYWQNYYPHPTGMSHLQQAPLLRPTLGPTIPQSSQYPGMQPSLPSGSQFPSDLLLPSGSNPVPNPGPLQPTPAPTSSSLSTQTSGNRSSNLALFSGKLPAFPQGAPSASSSESLPPVVSSKSVTAPSSSLAYQTTPQAVSSNIASSNSSSVESAVHLVKPDQILQSAPSIPSSSQSLQMPLQASSSSRTESKPAETKMPIAKPLIAEQPFQAAPKSKDPSQTKEPMLPSKTKEPLLPSKTKEPLLSPKTKEPLIPPQTKEPLLPLPRPTYHKPNGPLPYARNNGYNNFRGRARGSTNVFVGRATKFTEDFDFEAMNEKFKKEEVWGHLGKMAQSRDNDGEQNDEEFAYELEEEEAQASQLDSKPSYVKDDFFDSLSSSSQRTRFSEQLKIDTETFGNVQRNRPMGGPGRGFRGGRGRGPGPYYGRGGGQGNMGNNMNGGRGMVHGGARGNMNGGRGYSYAGRASYRRD